MQRQSAWGDAASLAAPDGLQSASSEASDSPRSSPCIQRGPKGYAAGLTLTLSRPAVLPLDLCYVLPPALGLSVPHGHGLAPGGGGGRAKRRGALCLVLALGSPGAQPSGWGEQEPSLYVDRAILQYRLGIGGSGRRADRRERKGDNARNGGQEERKKRVIMAANT